MNHAVIIGVLKRCDVPYDWIQPCHSFSSVGLSIPRFISGKVLLLKQTPDSILQGSKCFSKGFQNICGKLIINEMLLVS